MDFSEMRCSLEAIASAGYEDDDDVALSWAQSNINTLAKCMLAMMEHIEGTIESRVGPDAPPLEFPAPPDAG